MNIPGLAPITALAGVVCVSVGAGLVLAQDAWVPNQGTDDMTIFSIQDPSDTTTVPTGTEPHEGAATRDARRVFVSNRLDGSVSVYDTVTRAELDTDGNAANGITPIAVGSQPHGLAITPDNRHLLVTNDGSDDVMLIDVETFQVVSTVPDVGAAPHMVAIRPDGREAWVGNVAGGDVSVIDLERALTTPAEAVVCVTPGGAGAECRIPAGVGTEGVEFTRDGRTAYAANGGSDTVAVIDVATRSVVRQLSIPGGPRRVHVGPDGRRAYVTQLFGNSVSVIDTATHELLPAEAIDGVPNGLGLDVRADGRRLYVANFFSARASVLELPGGAVVEVIPTGQNPDSVVILPEEVFGVGFEGPETLVWHANAFAERYDVYRGTVAELPAYGACVNALDGDLQDTRLVDATLPATGQAFFYLVGVRHAGLAGSLDHASDGTPRTPAVACPP